MRKAAPSVSLLACALYGAIFTASAQTATESSPSGGEAEQRAPVVRRADGSIIEYDASEEEVFIDLCVKENEKCVSGVTARNATAGLEVYLPAEVLDRLSIASPALAEFSLPDKPDWYRLKGVELDPFELKASWSVPVTALVGQSLANATVEMVKVEEGKTPLTAALNYSVSYGDSFVGSGELAVGKKNTAFITSGSWSQATGQYIRGLSRLEHDVPSRKQRWVVGEQTATSNDVLGAGNLITGVGFGRAFEMDPTLITSSRPSLNGVLETAGTLEVYSNGILLLTRPVQPGPFSLEQLGIPNGRQNIELVLLDPNGNRRSVSKSLLYGSTRTLAKGLSEYGVQTGSVQRSGLSPSVGEGQVLPPLDPNNPDWPLVPIYNPSSDRRVTQAYYRKGVTDWLTLGGRADVGDQNQSYGLNLGIVGTWGEMGVSYGTSSQGGRALDVDYGLSGPRWSLGLGYRRLDSDYVLPGQVIVRPESRILQTTSLRGSVQLTRSIGLSYQGFENRYETGVKEHNESVNLSGQAWGGSRWTLSAFQLKRNDGTPSDRSVGFYVSVPIGKRQSFSASAQQEDAGTAYSTSWNLSRKGEFGVSAAASATQTAQGTQIYNTRADYQGRYGQVQVTADQSDGNQTVLGTINGGVVIGAGRVFFTQPLTGAMALLRSPQTPGVAGLRESSPVGTTDSKGDLFIRGLTPYYPSSIGLDTDVLPIDISPGDFASRGFVPTNRTLTVIEFNAAPVISVQAVMRWSDGASVRYGALTVQRNGVAEEISLGAEGLFYIENLPPGDYEGKLETTQGSGVCKFTVPENPEAFLDLGTIECQKTSGNSR